MDEITIEDLRVRTQVGISPHEVGKLQELSVTIRMMAPLKKPGETDKVEDTVNYKTITKEVLAHVENKRYNLIETVATDVARICVVRHVVPAVKVTVEKPNCLRFAKSSTVTIERCSDDFDWHHVHVSIGSNINPLENIPQAIKLLAKKSHVVKSSKAFITAPINCQVQAEFVNMAVLIKTKLDPEGLKLFLYEIEDQLGRKRDPVNKNAPRTIDLDITFWEDNVLEYRLVNGGSVKCWSVPDPDTTKYAHVIVPLADISPLFVHPTEKKTLAITAQEITGKQTFSSFFPTVNLQSQSGEATVGAVMNGMSTQANGSDLTETTAAVALITGGAKRIGAAIARRLHSAGYNIVVHYNLSVLQSSELVAELNSVRPNSAHSLQADLKIDIQNTAENLIREAVGLWGRLDVLVNNASIYYPTVIGSIGEETWNDLIQTNLAAPFFLCQAAHPSLKTSRGCIINLIDTHAVRPLANHSVYCISKAGLHMSTLALSKDFAPHVRVNGVAPGAILWPHKDVVNDEDLKKRQETIEKIPMGRRGEPEDIASAVEYLACHAGYVTGQVLNVDGGRTLHQ